MSSTKIVSLLVTIIVTFSLGMAGCGAKPPSEPKSPPEPGRYYDNGRGFSIKFPAGWQTQYENGGATVAALCPFENDDDMFAECVSVTVEDLPYKVSLDEFAKINDESRNEEYDKVVEEQRGELTIDNTRAKWVLFTYLMDEGVVKTLDCCTVKGQRAYLIMCDSEPHKYESYRKMLEGALVTFRFE